MLLLTINVSYAEENLLKDHSVYKFDISDGLISNKVDKIFQDLQGYIWTYNDLGLTKFDGIKFLFFTDKNSQTPELIRIKKKILKKRNLNSIHLFNRIRKKLKETDIIINCMLKTRNKLWIGTKGDGLFLLRNGKEEIIEKINIPIFKNDYINDIIQDKEKNIWIGTESNGLIRLVNKNSRSKLNLPIIEKIILNNIDITNKQQPLIENMRILEFHFTGIHYTAPEKLRFKYKLDGYDKTWKIIQPGFNRLKIYINLDPGNYSFLLRSGISENWSKKTIHYDFQIDDPEISNSRSVLFILLFLVLTFILFLYLLFRSKKNKIDNVQKQKYKTSGLNDEIAERILKELINYMKKGKPFLEPGLNLKKMSEILNIQYNHLSQIINEKLNQNSNDFINKYRIEEAKNLLLKDNKRSVLDIAYDCGFYSKSVFNTAFKKFTGKTPSQFRKNKS